jgi:cytochrome P450
MDQSLFYDTSASYYGWVLTATLTFAFVLWRKKVRFDSTPNLPPNAPGRSMDIAARMRSVDLHNYILETSRNVGKIVRFPLIPLLHNFMIADYKVARIVLENASCKKWTAGYGFFNKVCGGDNFFAAEEERHRHVRKATSVAFAKNSVEQMMESVETILDQWLDDKKEKSGNDDFECEIGDEMQIVTIQAIGKIGFNYDFSEDETVAVRDSLAIAYKEYAQNQRRYPQRKLFGIFYPGVRRAWQATRTLNKICGAVLKAYKPGSAPNSVLDCIQKDKNYKDDGERVRDIIVYLAGGYDTTSSTISWTLLELAKNTSIQQKLRSELRELPESQRRQCTALKHTIKESMRLNITAPLGALRILPSALPIGENIILPAKSMVFIATYAIQRDRDIFDQPDNFVPERWENPTPEMQQSWMGFSMGRRNCVGQALANAELSVVLAKLCCDYEWSVIVEGNGEFYVTLKTIGTVLKAKKVR